MSPTIGVPNIGGSEGAGIPIKATVAGINTASGYSATINWGDTSSPTAGTLVVVGNNLQISGSHTYADNRPANYTTTVTLLQ